MMDNYTIKQNHEEVIQAQTEKIEAMNSNIVELDTKRHEETERYNREIKELEDQLNEKIKKKQAIEDKCSQMSFKIQDLESVRNTLQEQMADQERDITKLKQEKATLDSQKKKLQIELQQKQTMLESKKLENEKLELKLADLKSKRTA